MKLKKVTAFITRNNNGQQELLLFKHPHAGIQIPAGTVEANERTDTAALREAFEESGLKNLKIKCEIGILRTQLPDNKYVITQKTGVFSRPDLKSFNWATFRRGITVEYKDREKDCFIHIQYCEYDDIDNPTYVTYQILGWIPKNCISKEIERHMYHLVVQGETKDFWEIDADNHVFHFFWAPINRLPNIVAPQNEWVDYVQNELNYNF